MADRYPAEIRIGGGIPTKLVQPLLEAIAAESVKLEYGDCTFEPRTTRELTDALQNDGTLRLVHEEACGGAFDDLEEFLVRHKIAFDRQSEAKYEYDACLTRYRPHLPEPATFPSTQSGDLLVSATPVLRAIDLLHRGKTEAAITLLTKEIGLDILPLPPLHTTDSDALRLPELPLTA